MFWQNPKHCLIGGLLFLVVAGLHVAYLDFEDAKNYFSKDGIRKRIASVKGGYNNRYDGLIASTAANKEKENDKLRLSWPENSSSEAGEESAASTNESNNNNKKKKASTMGNKNLRSNNNKSPPPVEKVDPRTTTHISAGRETTAPNPEPTTTAVSPPTTVQKEAENTSPLEQLQAATRCLELRGREGTWEPWEEGYQYRYAKKKRQPLPVTKWKWQDDHCSVQMLTPEGFCSVLHQLGIVRIYMVGDSLTYMMTESLWWLLGNADDPGNQFQSPFIRSFPCSYQEATTGKSINYMLEIAYARNDHLLTQAGLTRKSNCGERNGVCHGWIEDFSSNPAKTLLLANTGLHTTGEESQAYQEDINKFVEAIANLNRRDDLVMFRTSVPGHKNCASYQAPFSNYSQYRLHQDVPSGHYDPYRWDKVDGFNDYVKDKWSNLNNNNQVGHQPAAARGPKHWHLLDVYPMTVLRPDGHAKPPRDCLHYILPGPPDWWNHLLYSNLLDIATLTTSNPPPELPTPPLPVVSAEAVANENPTAKSVTKPEEPALLLTREEQLETTQVQVQVQASKCLNLRGQQGTWVPWDEGYDYVTPLRDPPPKDNIYIKFKNTKGNQDVPWPPTKWKWQDKHHEDCPIQLITKQGFCNVLQELGIQRIFLVGDSLTRMMSKSLWKLLDFTDDPGPALNSTFIRSFSCGSAAYPTTTAAAPGNSNNYTVEFDFFTQYRFVNDYDNPDSWFRYYSSNPAKTLLIINTGLHYARAQERAYLSDTKLLFETITNLKRTDDLVMFRTSVPGHKNCGQEQAPFTNSRKFQQHQDVKSPYDKYGWDKVDGFNRYVQENWFPQAQEQERGGDIIVNHKNWYLLDVYPMTLLRPDGHLRPPADCLHYILPGPPDWWNHLLYSNLLDIAALTSSKQQQLLLLLPELPTYLPVVSAEAVANENPSTKSVTKPEELLLLTREERLETTQVQAGNVGPSEAAQASSCLELRGQEGKWMPWEDGYGYVTPLNAKRGRAYGRFKAGKGNEHLPFPPTKWKWQDDYCPIQLLSPEGFCSVLHRLGIGRLFLVGDSLSYMMTQSLWKLLENTDDPGVEFSASTNRTFPCSYKETKTGKPISYMLDIEYFKQYKIGTRLGKKNPLWFESYSRNPTKTLLIANAGLHYSDKQEFQAHIDSFFESTTTLNRQDDLVMFRTSVPGHKNCATYQAPFSNYSQFQQHQDAKSEYDKYGWELADGFNRYVQEKWFNLNRTLSADGRPKNWQLLDVYPMTVLRPDGHQSPPKDCLHYNLPGAPDWWNHLLYNNLLDIATLATSNLLPALPTSLPRISTEDVISTKHVTKPEEPLLIMAEQPFKTTELQVGDIGPSGAAQAASCLEHRGQEGMWMPWEDGYQYATPLRGPRGQEFGIFKSKKENENIPFPPTKWKWQDNYCPMQLLSPEGFCSVLHQLGIGRLFLVGDSLSFMMTQSLMKLLTDRNLRDEFEHTSKSFPCTYHQKETGKSISHTLEIEYVRNDHLLTKPGLWNKAESSCTDREQYCNKCHCYSWLEHYSSNPTKTLLIANTGLHSTQGELQQASQGYQSDINNFVEAVTNLNRKDDLVMFRTSVPGHKNCAQEHAPFSTFSQFQRQQDVKSRYDEYGWDKVDGFNKYVKEKWFNLTSTLSPYRGPKNWHLLDVYPMTVLRPDGHQIPPKDCLHYNLPGPPDWWNHLLYNNLLDIATLTVSNPLPELPTPPLPDVSTKDVPRSKSTTTNPVTKPKEALPPAREKPSETTELQVGNIGPSAQLEAATRCLELRGREGMWQPWEEGYWYDIGGGEQKNNTVTKWKWQDNHCPMKMLTPEGFCGVLHQLGIARIYLVGDSLTYMMTDSLWGLLGNTDHSGDQFQSPYSRFFPCSYQEATGKSINYKLEIAFTRNDHLLTNPNLTRKSNCGNRNGACHGWIEDFSSNPAKTLLLVNTGLHTTGEASEAYQRDINNFVEAIAKLNRQDDLVMYRTSVPGHKNCAHHHTPFSNYSQFQLHQDTPSTHYDPYRWDKVDGFNDYVKEKWANLNSITQVGHQPATGRGLKHWHLLDVYPMTVLRPDGHLKPGRDCLHYSTPGPSDWWNHLLYSNLLDIATLSNEQNQL